MLWVFVRLSSVLLSKLHRSLWDIPYASVTFRGCGSLLPRPFHFLSVVATVPPTTPSVMEGRTRYYQASADPEGDTIRLPFPGSCRGFGIPSVAFPTLDAGTMQIAAG
jgi:hypothetical protein